MKEAVSTSRLLVGLMICIAALPLAQPGAALAQVTTATFYGSVVDSTGALIPNATVTMLHQQTGAATKKTTGPQGEFAFDFLRIGSYKLTIEASGFKRHEVTGIDLAAGQTVRQTFTLDLGAISETITVAGSASLVSTASSEQSQTFQALTVTELPLSRRNVTNVLKLATGIDVSEGHTRGLRIGGVGKHGTGVSVDGTEATGNPEGRGLSQYQGRNYVDVLSIDAVAEVQVIRGILPAEYGGVVGGQVNLITKSGTNALHGSLFENFQSHALQAREPFLPNRLSDGSMRPKPRTVFNQFGGSAGGPIIRDRAFIFGAYEGYRENSFSSQSGNVPSEQFRKQILGALPFPETKIILDTLPLQTEFRNQDQGYFIGARNLEKSENHVILKGDLRPTQASNLTVTYTRNRPYLLEPSFYVDGANDRTFHYAQDRVTLTYTVGAANWTSESRFGLNTNDMVRLNQFLLVKDPNHPEEEGSWGRRVGRISLAGTSGFGTPSSELWDMDGPTYSFDQKVARFAGAHHSFKFGGRYIFYGGSRTNPQNTSFSFQTKEDLLANIPSAITVSFGAPPHKTRMYEFGFFTQDDWRFNQKLTLNLGLRYDFYSHVVAEPTGKLDSAIYNPAPPSDWKKFDFGPFRDPTRPYESDGWINLGPRFGFAYSLQGQGKTVVRGGFGVLFSTNMPGLVRQSVGNPLVPFRITWSREEARRLGLKWPMYPDQFREIVAAEAARTGSRFIFSALNPGLQNPYAMHYQFNIQRALSRDLMFETAYVGVRGVKFPLHRYFNQQDRITGLRPNPALGAPGGYYVDNTQNMVYNGWQNSIRKRFSNNLAFDAHYTWGKGLGVTGGDIGGYYQGEVGTVNIQEFDHPRADRGPTVGDARHRFAGNFLYDLPRLASLGNRYARTVLGGWQLSGILLSRTGETATVNQSCSGYYCRPDYVGGDLIVDDWKNNYVPGCSTVGIHCPVKYLNTRAFAKVPLSTVSGATIRPGNASVGFVPIPVNWSVDLSIAKNVSLRENLSLQIRADAFNGLNHVNYSGLSSTIDSSTFGEMRSAGGMRVVQLNGRLTW